jgi:hypothetical protein
MSSVSYPPFDTLAPSVVRPLLTLHSILLHPLSFVRYLPFIRYSCTLTGMNGMFGNGMGGMGMFGGSFMGMNPCMPGFGLAPGMPGSLMCGGGSGRGGASKGGSGGGGKKQRENLPKQSVVILKTWMYVSKHPCA